MESKNTNNSVLIEKSIIDFTAKDGISRINKISNDGFL